MLINGSQFINPLDLPHFKCKVHLIMLPNKPVVSYLSIAPGKQINGSEWSLDQRHPRVRTGATGWCVCQCHGAHSIGSFLWSPKSCLLDDPGALLLCLVSLVGATDRESPTWSGLRRVLRGCFILNPALVVGNSHSSAVSGPGHAGDPPAQVG
jgi:hypothetical protein